MFYTCVLIFDIIMGDHATFRSTWTPPQVFIYEPINTFELCWYYCEFLPCNALYLYYIMNTVYLFLYSGFMYCFS